MRTRGTNSNPVVQGKLRALEKRGEEQRKKDLRDVMTLPAGRRFMYDLVFNRCELLSIYMDTDIGIQRHEGKRTVGGALAVELQEAHMEMYLLMISEQMTEQDNDRKLRDAAQTTRKDEDDDA